MVRKRAIKAMENVKISLVREKKSFADEKTGTIIEYWQYSLLFNGDCKTPIKPVFKNGKATLRIMSEIINKNETK